MSTSAAAGRAEGDQVDPLVGRLAQPDDVLLGGAFGGQEGQAGVAVLGLQAPGVGVEVELRGVVGHGEVDVPEVGDEALGHRVLLRGVRVCGLGGYSRGLAGEFGDGAHEAGDVALHVVEQPLGELVRRVDDGLARAR